MKKYYYLCLLVLSLCLFSSCGKTDPDTVAGGNDAGAVSGSHQTISAEQAYSLMAETDSYVLLDVRSEEEYKEQRIEGAILIPDTEIKSRAEEELPDRDAVILVYCRSGRRSANAAGELAAMGYTHVYDFGGIIDWPYETIGE